MALDTEPSTTSSAADEPLKSSLGRLSVGLAAAGTFLRPLWLWFLRTPPMRFIFGSLVRRILVSNLIGLIILIVGIFYLSQHHAWLIDAKRESLRTQGEIIAAAIAANATADTDRITIDPDQLTEDNSQLKFRDDEGFTDLQLSISPERIGRILRRLIQPTDNRARVYGRDGTLIVDSATLLSRGHLARMQTPPADQKIKTKNFWTRLTHWLIDKELPVYREIGTAKGTAYPEVRIALTGSTTPMLLLNDMGEQIVSMAVPIYRAKAVQGVLLLSTRPGEIDDILSEERMVIWTLAGLAVLATVVTSLLLARTVAGPMRRLSEAAERVSRDITARQALPHYADRVDEVGQMATAFGSMTASLYRRIEASERFAADVAHELKNPLTAARSTAEALSYAKTEEQRAQLVQQIQNELKRLNRLITDVSNASRLDAELARQHMRPLNVTTVLEGVTGIFRDILGGDTRQVRLVIEPAHVDGAFMVAGDDSRLGQVMTNLIDNAISFSPESGIVVVRARHRGPFVELIVEDEGPGIPDDRLNIVFDRFYTDRPLTEAIRGKNSGLGLSISREIVVAHGGEIWAENKSPGKPGEAGERGFGARFVVRLPALGPTARGGSSVGRRA